MKFVIVILALISLTACGNSTQAPSASPTASNSPSEAITVSTPSPTPVIKKESPKANVEAYSHYFLTGYGYKAYTLLSKRCASKMDKNYFEGLTLAAKQQFGDMPILTYSEKVSGNSAKVTYTYRDNRISQSEQPWVKENGQWKYDQC